jgi:hypothetical protein
MAGYVATSTTSLTLALGTQSLTTQSALGYVPGDKIQLTYAQNLNAYMTGSVTAYNPVTGAMTVSITAVFGTQLQPIWNTQLWGSTGGIFADWLLGLLQGLIETTATVVPSIIVRDQGPNWDAQRGQGLSNFLTDINAVAQIINSRLRLFQGEWYQNTNLGTPMFQSLLGKSITSQGVALILREQIIATPFVLDISSMQVTFSAGGRQFTFSAVVDTVFGAVTVGLA